MSYSFKDTLRFNPVLRFEIETFLSPDEVMERIPSLILVDAEHAGLFEWLKKDWVGETHVYAFSATKIGYSGRENGIYIIGRIFYENNKTIIRCTAEFVFPMATILISILIVTVLWASFLFYQSGKLLGPFLVMLLGLIPNIHRRRSLIKTLAKMEKDLKDLVL